MLTLLLIALTFFQVPPNPSPAEQCAWTEPVPPASSGSTSVEIEELDCLKVSPTSVIWLSSAGCSCSVNIRIRAKWKGCGTRSILDCDEFHFEYDIGGMSSDGGLVTDGHSGVASPTNPPPDILFEREMDVDCGAAFQFAFEASCSCWESTTTTTAEEIGDDLTSVVVGIVSVALRLLCEDEATLVEFIAWCTEECDIADPPDDIAIEVAD